MVRINLGKIIKIIGPLKVLCEVKTIRVSCKEREFRKGNEATTWSCYQLERGFFTKL